MSTLKVSVEKILKISPHPNADRLEIAEVLGWNCVTGKGVYKEGDLCVYIPIDSVLPPEVEVKIFPPDSKVKLHHSRVKTIKLRGAISQGLIVRPELLGVDESEGTDVTEALGIKKYEPVVRISANSSPAAASKKQVNPNFRKYTDIQNIKNYPRLFEEGETVTAREKIHGANFRAGYVPFHATTIVKKILKFLHLAPKNAFVYGSHNVQLQDKMLYQGFYDKNVYAEAVVKYELAKKLKAGEVVYGEVYGDGIQKGYHYGTVPGERMLAIFDVMIDGKWLDDADMEAFCTARGLPVAPKVYEGPYNLETLKKIADQPSTVAPNQDTPEGIVVKPVTDQMSYAGRKVLKLISAAYDLKKHQSDDSEEEFPH